MSNIFYIIPLVIIVASLLAILVLILRKLPQLRAISVKDMRSEQNKKVKNQLIAKRLTRLSRQASDQIKPVLIPILKEFKTAGKKLQTRAKELEIENKKRKQDKINKQKNEDPVADTQNVEVAIARAEKFREAGNFKKAEEAYVALLKTDSKNLNAYEGLTEVYLMAKEYGQAEETCRYVIKLVGKVKAGDKTKLHHLAVCRADLGEIYKAMGKPDKALDEFRKAVKLQPNNPRYLDLLLKICILLKNRSLAEETLARLEDVDSSNRKLKDLRKQIEKLSKVS